MDSDGGNKKGSKILQGSVNTTRSIKRPKIYIAPDTHSDDIYLEHDEQKLVMVSRTLPCKCPISVADGEPQELLQSDLSDAECVERQREKCRIFYDTLADTFEMSVQEDIEDSMNTFQVFTSHVTTIVQCQQNKSKSTADVTMDKMVFV